MAAKKKTTPAAKKKAAGAKIEKEKVAIAPKVEAPTPTTRILTEEDFENDPTLAEQGFVIGQEVEIDESEDEDVEEADDEEVADGTGEEEKEEEVVVPALTPSEKANVLAKNETAAVPKGAKSVDVINGNEYIRTYSQKEHGPTFLKLAEEFASKNSNRGLVDSDGIETLVVTYRVTDKKTGVVSSSSQIFTGPDFKAKAVNFRNQNNGDIAIR